VARPLEFKRRVHLSERDLDLKPPRARARSTPLVFGVVAYGCAFALAWAVSTHRLPLAETFTRVLAPPAEAKTSSRVELAASLPPLEPEPPSAALALAQSDPAKSEPTAEPEPSSEPAPEASSEPKLEPSLDAKLEQSRDAKLEQKPEQKLEPSLDAKPEPKPEPKPELKLEPKPEPARDAKQELPVASGGSCEAAIASYVEDANRKAPKDLGAADFGRVLNKGDYLDRCGVPTTTAVDICVAVQNGRAVGVTVRTAPSNGKLDRCLSRVLRGVSFPSHPRMDVVRTRFAN
jgi:hypothetical protein